MLLKKIAAAVAVVGVVVPVALAVRKQVNMRAVRSKLAKAKEAGRKVPHAAKPRRARRIARHLAKKIGHPASA
jgi:hypothetical protein